ncbi:MAG: hypothetical protein ACXW2D_11280, partial [Burkholderiaceae bacterium]
MRADLQLHQRAAMASLLTPVQAFGALTSVSFGPGSTRTVSDASAKVDLALDRLLMRGDTSAWVTVVTAAPESLR